MRYFWVVAAWSLLFAARPAQAGVALSAAGVQDRLMIVFKPGVTETQQRQMAAAYGLEVLRVFRPMRALVVRAKPNQARMMTIRLGYEPSVLLTGRDFYTKWIESSPESLQARPMPTLGSVMERLPELSPDLGKKPSEVQWGVQRVNAPAAWAANQGKGVKVAIVDTGIDPSHPEFAGRIMGGYNAIDEDSPWHDDHFHGTHVAGIVAAARDGQGVVGVAPEAHLYAVKVLTKDGSGSLFGIMGGIMWCVENGMQVVNMSLGAAQGHPLFEHAVNALADADIPLIAAAGNDGKAVNFPAKYAAAIAISALDEKDGIAKFSSRGPEIEFIAPGVKVPSTITGGGIKAYSGTSMATPHVTGLAALAIAAGAQGQAGVRQALSSAAVKIEGLSPTEQGSGVTDAGQLVR
ncbi:MAG: S8 family peptidase [Elusimicrobiota bacterium]